MSDARLQPARPSVLTRESARVRHRHTGRTGRISADVAQTPGHVRVLFDGEAASRSVPSSALIYLDERAG